jgi:polar amino acid transport system substrate-binding protein
MMKLNIIFVTLIVGAIAVIGLIIFTTPHEQSLTRLQKAGVIKIGYSVEAPYVFLKPGGEVTGGEAEVAKTVIARLGIQRIEWRLSEFDDLIPDLEAGRIDAIVAGMFITADRAKIVSFSEPTFHVQMGLLVRAGNPRQLHSYNQAIDQPDVKIAVISGAAEGPLLKQLGLSASQLVFVPDALTGRAAVENGDADGLALSVQTIRWMALQDQLGRAEMAQPFEQPKLAQKQHLGYGAVVFRQDDRQLRLAWNAAQKGFIGSPEHLRLITPFGFTTSELPGSVATQEIIPQP